MNKTERTRYLIAEHYNKYPLMQLQDIIKFISQSSFGCEHFVSSFDVALQRIREEEKNVAEDTSFHTDSLDGAYTRVHLNCLKQGVKAQTLAKLFMLSAEKEPEGRIRAEEKIKIVKEMIKEKLLPFSDTEFDTIAQEWKNHGYPAVHHSQVFREAYCPSYRVVADKFIPFMPLFAKIDVLLEKGRVILAVEGGSGSGKTTLGEMLRDIYGCTVFHMDDFFLRPEQRTSDRFAQVGGNVDRERFLEEVLIPLSQNQPVDYRRFDCSTFTLEQPVKIYPEKLTVIEGAYSMHPSLVGNYNLTVFLDVSPELQRKRISVRNTPQMAQRFYNEWIPLEREYFAQTDIRKRCDMRIEIKE